MARYEDVKVMSLEQFMKAKGPEGLEDVLSRINGGTFMDCHKLIAQETGVWIEDLVPVFQRLDAALASRPLPDKLAR